jgi:hypothetical protein
MRELEELKADGGQFASGGGTPQEEKIFDRITR